MENIYLLFLAGAAGSLIKEILEDNKLKIPTIKENFLDLGFLGGLIIGAAAGYAIDGSYITAFMGGLSGTTIIKGLMSKNLEIKTEEKKSIEEQIREICAKEGVDPELTIRVASCESSLNPDAKNDNGENGIDRGLFQINSKYHPEVTDEQAYDIEFSTTFFCKAFKSGNLSWWNASKKCWDK